MQKINLYFTRSFSTNFHFINSVRNYFNKKNIETFIVVSHPDRDSPTLLSADIALIEPSFIADENEQFYKETSLEYKIDCIIPGETSILTLIKPESFIHIYKTKVLTSHSFEFINALKSKSATYKLFSSIKISDLHIPLHKLIKNVTEFEKYYFELLDKQLSVCFKPDVSQGGAGFRIIDNSINPVDAILGYVSVRNTFDYYVDKLKKIKTFPSLIVLEYLNGIEYSIDCFGHGKELIFCGIREKTNKKRKIISNEVLKKIAQDIQAIFNFTTLYNIQIREKDGKYYLLEINPRYSAGSYIYELEGYHLLGKAIDIKLNNVSFHPFEIPPFLVHTMENYLKKS